MPVLELGGLITAVTGYGPGTAHQKMVMKCVFVFPAFTIFCSVLCSSSLFPVFFGKTQGLTTIVANLRGAGARMRKSDLDYPSGS